MTHKEAGPLLFQCDFEVVLISSAEGDPTVDFLPKNTLVVFVELLRRGEVFFGGVEFLCCLAAPVVAVKQFQLMFLGDDGVAESRSTFAEAFEGVLRVR